MATNTPTPVRLLQLNRLVLHHSALLRRLALLLNQTVNDELADSPQRRFLQLVLLYDEASHTQTPDWRTMYDDFSFLSASLEPPIDPAINFFLPNYQFLTLRNATSGNQEQEILNSLAVAAHEATFRFQGTPLFSLLNGFRDFYVARWEHRLGNFKAAEDIFLRAAKARVDWYQYVHMMCEDASIVCAAAEQVRKLPDAFMKMFPKGTMSQLNISNELMQEVQLIAPGDREVK